MTVETIGEVLDELEKNLNSTQKVKISIVFANNATGKTRLSKLLTENYGANEVLCYNAFLEDFFTWDNEGYILNLHENSWVKELIKDRGIDREIINNFQKFTTSKIEPRFNSSFEKITFRIPSDKELQDTNIKISKGEESVFIWSVFYTILKEVVDTLLEKSENRSTNIFDNTKYIVIDDPVSSMDDTKIITIALDIIDLIHEIVEKQYLLNNKLKFLITTHHALFFNILNNSCNSTHKQQYKLHHENFVLSKIDEKYSLNKQGKGVPFAYHHAIISEIEEAIKKNAIRKYHFNLFRCLLEKTANFLGYTGSWRVLLDDNDNKDLIAKILNEYSHSQMSETEPQYVYENEKVIFKQTFNNFIKEYKWNNEKNE